VQNTNKGEPLLGPTRKGMRVDIGFGGRTRVLWWLAALHDDTISVPPSPSLETPGPFSILFDNPIVAPGYI